MKITAIIIGIICLTIVITFISIRNRFVLMRNRVENQNAQIDVQLKRRYDLIPNLVEVVKGCANFERDTLETVTKARTAAIQSKNHEQELHANEELTTALHQLTIVSESYPELQSNQNFLKLQEELASTEDKIAMARQFSIDTVMRYNTSIEVFPANIVAKLLGYQKIDMGKFSETDSHIQF